MSEEIKTATQIARMIREQAEVTLGPWPRDLEIFIFVVKLDWKCGLSPAQHDSEVDYREGVLRIAGELQKTVRVIA